MKINNTLPFHYRATLHFGYPPKAGTVLQEYADNFLKRYYDCCGMKMNEQQHAHNVACFAALPAVGAVQASIPLIDPELVIKALPTALQQNVRGLQANLCTILRGVYPLVNGEKILNDYVTILNQDYLDCPAGCVVYVRETNLIRIDFILPSIRFDSRTGQPSIVASAPRERTAPSIKPEMALVSTPTLSQGVSLVGQVASTLAFAAPPPYGIMASAAIIGVTGLFSILFGGDSGPSMVDTIATLIDNAVQELEQYLDKNQLESVQGDVTAFFQWCSQQIQSNAGWTDADINHVKIDLLPHLNNTYSFEHATLYNDLQQVAIEQYTQTNKYVPREQDLALGVVSMNITALLCVLKLTIQLAAQVASSNQPDDGAGSCASPQADQDFQYYSNSWIRTIPLLVNFINGTPPSADDSKEIQAKKYTLDYIASALTRCYRDNNMADPDIQYITQNFGDQGALPWTSMADYAQTYGWAAAMERLVLHKQVARLLKITPVTYYDTRNSQCFSGGGPAATPHCHEEGSDGWQFIDNFDSNGSYRHDTDYWSSGCCDQNEHTNDYKADVVQHWNDHFNTVLQQLKTAQDNTASFADDLKNAQGWRDAASTGQALLPLATPANTIVVPDDKWGGPADANSQWANAIKVRYAISFLNAKGPSARSDWSAEFDVTNRNKPLLRHIPLDPANNVTGRQIWRQFLYKDSVGDPDLWGLPKIVGILGNDTTTDWTDNDPAPGKAPVA